MHKSIKNKQPNYKLTKNGEFIIDNYNHAKPFANFFPGIAGKYGIPMWAFYVNRGQGICSFGTKDKDHAILEFFPANKAWATTSILGFRTFIKILRGNNTLFYEPFHNGATNLNFDLSNRMIITSQGMSLEETNQTLGLKVKVEFFTIPNDSYAGLGRIISIQNLKKTPINMQILDGLPQIQPFGMNSWLVKEMSRTIEAWMNVENLENKAPFFRLAVDPQDRPEVIHIKEGNFYLGYYHDGKNTKIIKPIVNPYHIFGEITDFSFPKEFLKTKKFGYPKNEFANGITPCAFSLFDINLSSNKTIVFNSIAGYMRSVEALNKSIDRLSTLEYLTNKKEENRNIINELKNDIITNSDSNEFNHYVTQTYLDNIMRGGYPLVFESKNQKSVFYLYSRKHGDLERDYNRFQLQPTYFSQGNGNYRDVNQNRRMDVWFNPEVKDEILINLINLLQTDGFNPLVVKGLNFVLTNPETLKSKLSRIISETTKIDSLISFLKKPFSPGDVILFLEDHSIKIASSYDELLNTIISSSSKINEAEHGEGFWTDHWTYNLDLIENYLKVYPEDLCNIIFDKRVFTFFDNTETVKHRSEKYVLYNGLPRQLHSVGLDIAKKDLIKKRSTLAHVVRSNFGEGEIYETTLINKLLCLAVNKLSSIDPFGIGIEMEANKPNWYDSLNGLPALFGSSSCETFELKRLCEFLKEALAKTNHKKITITEEIYHFLNSLNKLLEDYLTSNGTDKDLIYWDKSNTLKESYRDSTKLGLSGAELDISSDELLRFLNNSITKLNSGLKKAFDKSEQMYYSYFINEVTEFDTIKDNSIKPKKFKQIKLPFFLESQVHALRTLDDKTSITNLSKAVSKGSLFDKKLKHYKVNSPLKEMPEEIGRTRIFTPGWLENESIWMHMEYKYLLELLKKGLFEDFYRDFKNVLIPFQSPKRYGRSILENSSFIVSSAYPDKNLHGNGFVARLSGSTAEFLQIWLIMNTGLNPFFLNEKGELNLRFSPILAGWLFDKKNRTYTFNFLSKVKVCYHNLKKKDTFGINAAKIKKIIFIDQKETLVELNTNVIPAPYANQIRKRQIQKIDIYLD
ncbi:MAG: cellobiose phosphorylase [Candidatus Omnitrophica bacterium]|nr:cellobiose phosphorylase [Candidatus Omnitrophota bacterium]